jgi:hypothetical protein
MEPSFLNVYRGKVDTYKTELDTLSSRLFVLSMLRLVFFAAFAGFIIAAFRTGLEGKTVYTISCLLLFILFVVWSFQLQQRKKFVQKLLLINENELEVQAGKSSVLYDGSDISSVPSFAVDLNVFGHNALFHLVNRAGSQSGKQRLIRHFSSPFTSAVDIMRYQECIRELASKTDFRQQLLAKCLLIGDESGLDALLEAVPEEKFSILETPFIRLLSFGWPVLGVAVAIYALWSGNISALLLFLVIGLLISGLLAKKTGALYNHISRKSYLYTRYAQCFHLVSKEIFVHAYLQQKKDTVTHAGHAFKKLSGIVTWFDLRLNILLSPVVNGFFLADLLNARRYLHWNRKYQLYVQDWFDTLGEMEVLNSLATFHFNHPHFIFPVPEHSGAGMKGTGIGHPLMQADKAVLNDIAIGEPSKLHLVTGSNMSGKSTYLRTIGLNILLAQTGAPVFAQDFRFTPLRLLTSFHHIDSLEEGSSYFYAELKGLQNIILQLGGPVPALVLLDEVMRGTNSADKHEGTAMLIRKLLDHHCLTLIATHDTDLGLLEQQYNGKIENYCFESELMPDGLHFDFLRRKGIAQTKNATYLMQQMGIV